MNILLQKMKPLCCAAYTRFIETASNLKEALQKPVPGKRLVVEPLSNREVVRVEGEDVVPFLQGLITNDMSQLENSNTPNEAGSMYTMFLNKAGRVLYDSIIYRTADPNTYLLECDKMVSNELRRHLRLYRVRRKIQIDSVDKEFKPWIVFNPDIDSDTSFDTSRLSPEIYSAPDPRVRELGLRVLTTPDKTWRDISKVFARQGEISVMAPNKEINYHMHRYRCGVGEGVEDLPPGKCFPLEANGDFLHGVSFHKGCYIGQELTARVHHTGVVRKRLLPLRLTAPITNTNIDVKTLAGAKVGNVRGISFNRALALLRVEPSLNAPELMIDGDPCYVEKPKWWPTEVTQNTRIRESF